MISNPEPSSDSRPQTETDQGGYEARLRAVLDASVDAILTIDERGMIQSLNRATLEMFGYSEAELLGQNISILMPVPYSQEHDQYLKRYLRTGEQRVLGNTREATAQRKDGSTFPIELSVGEGDHASAHRFTGFVRDISRKQELEIRFLRAQRLESIGTLVSGIAHDLNNVLTPVLMALKLLKKDRPGIDRADLLETAQMSAERGVALIRQLLTFAGGVSNEKTAVQLQAVISEVINLLEHTFPKSIVLRCEMTDRPVTVIGDITQLSQVLLNLCVNARDAMPEGGTLTVSVAQTRLAAHTVERYPGAKVGVYAILSVADTGVGIPPDVQQKIFDPFFTTKPFGKGTGLGLSTVLGIVKSHDGFVNVYSELNRGTKMSVFLPAVENNWESSSEAEDPVLTPANGELILVVDDEVPILSMVRTTLETHGYHVLTASSGGEAIRLFEEHGEKISAILLDMMMPGIDGPVVLSQIRRTSSKVPIIAASGLRPTDRFAAAIAAAKARFLLKPYSDDELLDSIGKLLQRIVSP